NPLFVRKLTEAEQVTLNEWLQSGDLERARRAQVIIQSAAGRTAIEIGQALGFHPDNLKKWIRRFNQQSISGIEVQKRGPRSRFTSSQITALLELYHQPPEYLGLPFKIWTPQKLALAAVKRGIVPNISHVTMRQILNEMVELPAKESIQTEPEIRSEPTREPARPPRPPSALSFLNPLSNTGKSPLSVAELVAAGQTALRRSENLEAVQIFQQLLGRPEMTLDLEAQVRCYLSEALEALSNYEEMLAAVAMYEDTVLRAQLSPKFQARVKLRLGWAYCRLANFAKAIARFNEARPVFIELDDQEGIGNAHYGLGYVYIEINEFNLARGYLLKALDNLRFSSDVRLLAWVYINLGMVSYEEGDFEGAKASNLKAQEFAEGLTDSNLLGLIYMNLGAVYVNYGKRDEATECFKRAIEEFTLCSQKNRLARAYNNLGNNLLLSGRWQEASESLSRALELARELGDREDTCLTLITLGELRFFQGEYTKAEECLLSALGLLSDGGDKWVETYAQRLLGRLYITTNRPEKALQALRTALQMATRIGNLYEVCLSHLALAEHHFSQQGYEQAEEYLELAKENLKSKRDPDLSANGWAQRLAGKLALARQHFEEAKQHISASINIFASINDKYELASSRFEMGLLYTQIGDQIASREHLNEARGVFMELGAKVALQRCDDLLLALQRGELPQTPNLVEVKLSKDVLLMQRLIEAATSRDLLLKELATVIYENFAIQKLVIFDTNNRNMLQPFVALGCNHTEAVALASQVSANTNFGKTAIGNSSIYLLEDQVNTRVWLYLEPKGNNQADLPRLKPLLKQAELALENCSLRSLNRAILVQDSDKVRVQSLIPGFIYASSAMYDVVERIQKIRTSDTTVLITGESGTGKELVARAVHAESARRDAIFLPFNCTTTPKEIIDSQLFGHRRGAFTGATANYQGIIRAAEGGTLFLDEIGDLSLEVQPKLLRFLEAGEIQPLGETKPVKVDVRVLAATNVDLERAVEEGRFREDLHYRLNIIRIHVPPLRERKEEIPLLASHYLQHFAARSGRKNISLSQEALHYLSNYYWPGNVRQLRNEIERVIAYSMDDIVLTPRDLSPEITRINAAPSPLETRKAMVAVAAAPIPAPVVSPPISSNFTLKEATNQLERELIEKTLIRNKFNITRAAKELGLSRRGLYLKMVQFGFAGQE
ncbi:MAG: sigma 54-interacting transcriptional regulator, partial [Acidobacteriota bacterium]